MLRKFRGDSPRDQLLAVPDALDELLANDYFNGCFFVNVAGQFLLPHVPVQGFHPFFLISGFTVPLFLPLHVYSIHGLVRVKCSNAKNACCESNAGDARATPTAGIEERG